MALLIAVVVLLLMSALGLAALQHAGDEASGSGRARRKDATLYAADSGLKEIQAQLASKWVAAAAPGSVFLDEPTLVKDGFGNPIAIRSGVPENGGLPAAPAPIDPGVGTKPTEGYDARQGGQGPTFGTAPVDVTAVDVANGMVHLQAQFLVQVDTGKGNY